MSRPPNVQQLNELHQRLPEFDAEMVEKLCGQPELFRRLLLRFDAGSDFCQVPVFPNGLEPLDLLDGIYKLCGRPLAKEYLVEASRAGVVAHTEGLPGSKLRRVLTAFGFSVCEELEQVPGKKGGVCGTVQRFFKLVAIPFSEGARLRYCEESSEIEGMQACVECAIAIMVAHPHLVPAKTVVVFTARHSSDVDFWVLWWKQRKLCLETVSPDQKIVPGHPFVLARETLSAAE